MNIPESKAERIIIIGGGFGGLHLAKGLKNSGYQVVMLDKNNYHTFQPLLYQVATSGLEPDSIAYPIRNIFKKQDNFFFRMATVHEIVSEKKMLITDIGTIQYNYLVIATGTTTNFFGIEGVKEHAMTMKSVSEALDLRSLILQSFEKALLEEGDKQAAYMSFSIVGAGPTGVELAGALGELKNHILPADYPDLDLSKMEINLIEMADEVLPPMSGIASQKAKKYLEELGANVMLKESVEGYDGENLRFKSGKTLHSRTLIWAAGVKGNLVNGIEKTAIDKGRYKVNRTNLVESYADIYAIGDVSLMKTPDFPEGLPQLAPVANQQGEFLAENFMRIKEGKETKAFEYKDLGVMATIGRNRAVVDMGKLKFQGIIAWFVWMFVHLLSLVGFRNKIVTLFNWTYNYFSFDRGVRLIIRKYKR